MKTSRILFFDVGCTLICEDAVWAVRCREQAAGDEARALGLTAFGILDFFDPRAIISSWDWQVMKPDRRLFTIACAQAGVAPQEAVMIGDRLDNDIAPAKAVEMRTIWIRQGFGGMQSPRGPGEAPDRTVDRLRDLRDLL